MEGSHCTKNMLFFLGLCVCISCEIHHYRIVGENNQLSQQLVENELRYLKTDFWPSLLCCAHLWHLNTYGSTKSWPFIQNETENQSQPEILKCINIGWKSTIGGSICPYQVCIFFQIIWKGSHHLRLSVVPVIWKGNGASNGMKLFQIYGAKCGYLCNVEFYCGAYSANINHNMLFSVVNSLCELIKN
jgi:hypothetical protein